MKNKGLSPIIATLLFIAIAIIVAIIVFAFVTGLIGVLKAQCQTNNCKTITISNSTIITTISINNGEILHASCMDLFKWINGNATSNIPLATFMLEIYNNNRCNV